MAAARVQCALAGREGNPLFEKIRSTLEEATHEAGQAHTGRIVVREALTVLAPECVGVPDPCFGPQPAAKSRQSPQVDQAVAHASHR